MKKKVYVILIDGKLDGVFTDLYLAVKRCEELQSILCGTCAKKIQLYQCRLNHGLYITKNEE